MKDATATAETEADAAARRRLRIVVNPAAGPDRQAHLARVIAALEALGARPEVVETDGPGAAAEYARTVDAARIDALVIAGGDGTINEAVNGLAMRAGTPPPLALIPLGTANVLAGEIGLDARDPQAVARAIVAGPAREIALVEVAGADGGVRHVTLMAGVGFEARVVDGIDLALKARLGKGAYVWQGLREWLRLGRDMYDLTVDGRPTQAAAAIVANGRNYAGRYVVAPEADLTAPSLEVVLFRTPGRWALLRYGLALALGRLSRLDDVDIVTAREVAVDSRAGEPVQADGDVVARLPVTIRVASTRIRLVYPA